MASPDNTPATRRGKALVSDLAAGAWGAWGLLVAQFLLLVVSAGDRLSGVWETQMAGFGLLPSWLLIGLLPGLGGGLLARAVRANTRKTRLAVGIGVACFFAVVAYGVGGGRHLADWHTRSAFAAAVAACTGVSAFLGAPILTRVGHRASAVVLLTLCATGLFEALNGFVLVRLYPAFHAALSALAWAIAGWGAATLLSVKRVGQTGAVLCTIAALIGVLPGSRLVTGFDNFRWVVAEGSPSLDWGVQLASHLAPPEALDPSLAELPLGHRRKTKAVDLRGHDVLLISIDALRADHLGAYGYDRGTSPAIDALAQQGVVFDAAYAPTPHTSYSITSLMTGKYMRPLLLQGAGADSEQWATLMQAYDYRTAAFYPPAVFFIDTTKFTRFRKEKLGFEYAKVEFAEGDVRVSQVESYLKGVPEGRRVFTWVHLFGPHEPYEADERFDFGERDIDLYDSEIRSADDTVGRVIKLARARDPEVVILLTADHGEEFGDHGGRYHGTTVYEEQVRVPLIIAGGPVAQSKRVSQPVQTIDLMPTVLSGLQIPVPPRIRGRDLSPLLSGGEEGNDEPGRAVAETDDYTLLAEGKFRLICQRKSGACQLYDIVADPGQQVDITGQHPERAKQMRRRARSLAETHGKYESQGLRAQGQGWPPAILLGLSGNAEVAPTLAALLDDADVAIRRKSAELLFDLANTGQAPALRLAMTREEDDEARAWLALSLTRLGQGAPLVFELLKGKHKTFSQLAALALAEAGRGDGEEELIRWWATDKELEHETALRILKAFAKVRSTDAVPYLVRSLGDVRLRPFIAETLAAIGDKDAIAHLALRLNKERYQSARLPLAEALVNLGADDELIVPLRRFLGVPERLVGGLGVAQRAGILEDLGGPSPQERARLEQLSDSGIRLSLVVPPAPKGSRGVRLIIRARTRTGDSGEILVAPAPPRVPVKKDTLRSRNQPEIRRDAASKLALPKGSPETYQEVALTLPERFNAKPGHHLGLDLFAPGGMQIVAVAAVPLRAALPPPPPEPWKAADQKSDKGDGKPTESRQNPSP